MDTGKDSKEAKPSQKEKEIIDRFEKASAFFTSLLEEYNSSSCQCGFPRYQQIAGIDCASMRQSFKSYDTDLLIGLSKKYFDIGPSALTDECTNEKWVCKKCGSVYEYGWSDFSIHVERQKLKLTELKAAVKGKPALKPIPLFLGLMGHTYPPKSEITGVAFEAFQDYMNEK